MLCGNSDPSQLDLNTIWIYQDIRQFEHSANSFRKARRIKSSSAVYHKPTTGRQAVSCKDLESYRNVDLLIELLASQFDGAGFPEKFFFFYCFAEISAQTLCIAHPQ